MIKASLLGRLGEDAREVQTSNGSSFISMRVASNERVNKENVTTWVTVNANSERYKNLLPHLKKGSAVFVTGSLRSTIYTAKDGKVGIDNKLSADSIEFANLGGNRDENSSNEGNSTNNANITPVASKQDKLAAMTASVPVGTTPVVNATPTQADDDDLPF